MVRGVLMALMLCSLVVAARPMEAKQQNVADDSFWVFGAGATDCGKLTSELRTSRRSSEQFYENYITGFFTGANFHARIAGKGPTQLGRGKSPEAFLAAVEQYCGNHPLDTVTSALEDVYGQLLAK